MDQERVQEWVHGHCFEEPGEAYGELEEDEIEEAEADVDGLEDGED